MKSSPALSLRLQLVDRVRPTIVANPEQIDKGFPVIGPLLVFTAIGWVSVALSPWLIQWPLLLIAVNPRMLFLLLVAPKLGLAEFTLVASIRLCLADPFSYMLGFRYGGRVRDRIDRSRLRSWLMRVTSVEKSACAVAIWLRPSQSILAWAGSLRLSPKYVAVSDVITTVIYVVLIHQGMSLF